MNIGGIFMDLKQKLVEIVAEYREMDPAEIRTDVPFIELGLDSLDVAELAMNVEKELGLMVELAPQYNSIDKMVAYLEALQG